MGCKHKVVRKLHHTVNLKPTKLKKVLVFTAAAKQFIARFYAFMLRGDQGQKYTWKDF
jgi:hypothetical protein